MRAAILALLAACGSVAASDPSERTTGQLEAFPGILDAGQEAFRLGDGGWDVETPGVTCQESDDQNDAGLPCCPYTYQVNDFCQPCTPMAMCYEIVSSQGPRPCAAGLAICEDTSLTCCVSGGSL